jgi:hypothetical protein
MADLIASLRAAREACTVRGRTEGFSAAVGAVMASRKGIQSVEKLREGLATVPCRRCAGRGEVMTQTGWQGCNGHNAMGCVNGRSFTPAAQREIKIRMATAELDSLRACWKALAAMKPVTRSDHSQLARELEFIKTQGQFARKALEAAQR